MQPEEHAMSQVNVALDKVRSNGAPAIGWS